MLSKCNNVAEHVDCMREAVIDSETYCKQKHSTLRFFNYLQSGASC